jgi:hypothetical protein
MPIHSLLFAALLAAGPAVTIRPLSGDPQSGTLISVTAEAVTLDTTGGQQAIEINSLRSVAFTAVEPPDQFADPPVIEVWLTDGSLLACTQVLSQQDQFTLTVEDVGAIKLPRAALRAIRLAPAERLEGRWSDLRERENASDLVVVERQDSLDFVEASVGGFTEADVSVLIQDQNRSIPRARTFGVVFAQPAAPPARSNVQLHLGRSTFQAAEVGITDATVSLTLASEPKLQLPQERVRLIEFTGRVRLLGDLQPVVELPSGVSADEQFRFFRRGSEPFGAPLRIGSNEVITTEGLWLHSGVTVRYRINRDFRRLVGIAGMDHNVGGNRSVKLVIAGDGQPLFDQTIRWADPAVDLDLDVAGVRDLEVRVERLPEGLRTNIFGIQEHLDLGNIRLVR